MLLGPASPTVASPALPKMTLSAIAATSQLVGPTVGQHVSPAIRTDVQDSFRLSYYYSSPVRDSSGDVGDVKLFSLPVKCPEYQNRSHTPSQISSVPTRPRPVSSSEDMDDILGRYVDLAPPNKSCGPSSPRSPPSSRGKDAERRAAVSSTVQMPPKTSDDSECPTKCQQTLPTKTLVSIPHSSRETGTSPRTSTGSEDVQKVPASTTKIKEHGRLRLPSVWSLDTEQGPARKDEADDDVCSPISSTWSHDTEKNPPSNTTTDSQGKESGKSRTCKKQGRQIKNKHSGCRHKMAPGKRILDGCLLLVPLISAFVLLAATCLPGTWWRSHLSIGRLSLNVASDQLVKRATHIGDMQFTDGSFMLGLLGYCWLPESGR